MQEFPRAEGDPFTWAGRVAWIVLGDPGFLRTCAVLVGLVILAFHVAV